MVDPLNCLWPIAEAITPIVSASAMSRWPKDSRERLLAAGLLKSAGTAKRVRCPACDRHHIEEVVAREAAEGQVRYYVSCPEVMRAEVRPEEMELFAVAIESLAMSIASLLSLSGTCKALASDRVGRCGRWTDQGVLRDVLFARGLRRNDATQFRQAITRAHRPVIFVGSDIPDREFWQGKIPSVIRLSKVA